MSTEGSAWAGILGVVWFAGLGIWSLVAGSDQMEARAKVLAERGWPGWLLGTRSTRRWQARIVGIVCLAVAVLVAWIMFDQWIGG